MSTITWRGGPNGDWSAGYDWSGGVAPQAGDTVVIGDGADVTIDTPGVAALDITLGATSTLDLAGTLDLGGTLYGGELLLAGTLVGGTLDAPLDVGLVGSVLDGVDVLGGQPLGDIVMTPATAAATAPLPIISSGDLTLDPGTYDGAFQFDDLYNAAVVFQTVGDMTFASTATVTVSGPDVTAFNGTGTVTNDGGISFGGDTTPLTYPFGNAVEIEGDGFVNAGTFTIAPNAGTAEPVPTGLNVSDIVFDNTGLLSDPAGTIGIGGDTFENSGTITAAQVVVGGDVGDFVNTGGIVAGSIVFDNAVTLARLTGLAGVVTIGGTLHLHGGTLDAGAFGTGFTVTGTAENGTLTATGGLLTLDGATLNNVVIQPGGDVVVAGPITLIDPPAAGGATLDGTTTDIVATSAAVLITLAINTASVSASGSLTLSSARATLTGTGISIIGTGGDIDGASIDIAAGTLDIATTLAGAYAITLGADTALMAAGETLGGHGTITLGVGAGITADTLGPGVTLDGLQAGSLIDLTGLSPVGDVTPSAQIVDGTLEITAASGQTASIALENPPADAPLLVLNDGQGGSLIADPPLPPLTAETNFNGTPGTDYGSYGLDGDSLSQGDVTVQGTYAVDLLDGAVWRTGTLAIGPLIFTGPYDEAGAGALTINGTGPDGGTLVVNGLLALGQFGDAGAGELTVDDSSVVAPSLSMAYSTITLGANSSVAIGGAAASDGALTLAAGTTLNVTDGTVTGNVIDDGVVAITASDYYDFEQTSFVVSGNFTYAGTIDVGDNTHLDVGGTLSVLAGGSISDYGFDFADGLNVGDEIVLGQDQSSAGAITVANDVAGAAGLSLFDGSQVTLGQNGALALGDNSNFEYGAVSVGDNATLSADIGTIDANVVDAGVLTVGASLGISGTLTLSNTVDVAAGATLALGALSGGGLTLEGGATLDAVAGGATIADVGGYLHLNGTNFTGLTVNGMVSGTVDLADVAFSDAYGENVGSATVGGASFAADPDSGMRLFTSTDGHGGTLITAESSELACFAAGTRILAEHGEIPVEALRPGDLVRTASGRLGPVAWIGQTTINLSRHPEPARATPIRVAADAIAPGVPCRDLYLSRDHAVLLDGALIPVWQLANGASIARDDSWRSVTYFHVELDRHDIVLAEGLASESYLDTGNRGLFANARGVRPLHAKFPEPDADALRVWAERAAAPLLLDGPVVAAHRARLLARAKTLGWEQSDDAALACFANGVALPIDRDADGWRARIPRHVTSLRLRSRSFIQAERGRDSGDLRRLGLAVSALVLDGHILPPDCLGAGWQAPDTTDTPWRWTDGDAHVALPPRAGAARLDIRLAYGERYLARRAVAARATA
jgi:hypothetical protein